MEQPINPHAAYAELTVTTPLDGRPIETVAAGLAALISTMDEGRAHVISARQRIGAELTDDHMPRLDILHAPRLIHRPLGTLGLSAAETVVLSLVVHGMSNKTIDKTTRESTIPAADYVLNGLYNRFGVQNRTAAVAVAWGIRPPGNTEMANLEPSGVTFSTGEPVPPALRKDILPGLRVSPRTRDNVLLLGLGYDNRAIADTLGIGEGTVKVQLARLNNVLGEHERTAKMAVAFGILHPKIELPRKKGH